MSASLRVVGFRPADEKFFKMKAIWDACTSAGIQVPDEVENFFNGDEPDVRGVKVQLMGSKAVRLYNAEMREGFDVDVAQLPPGVTVIRFYASY